MTYVIVLRETNNLSSNRLEFVQVDILALVDLTALFLVLARHGRCSSVSDYRPLESNEGED